MNHINYLKDRFYQMLPCPPSEIHPGLMQAFNALIIFNAEAHHRIDRLEKELKDLRVEKEAK